MITNNTAATAGLEAGALARDAVFGMAAACGNTASFDIINASSDARFDANYGPANVIDGDLSTQSRWSSADSAPSIILDLGSIEVISEIRTAWYRADIREAYFDVQTSADGSSWNTVLAGGSVSGTQDLQSLQVTESKGRYVKIIGGGNSDSIWTSLVEAQVFGCSASPVVTPEVACRGTDNLTILRATSEDSYDVAYGPANAIDGDLGSDSRWSSNGVGRSLVLDLGETSAVSRISTAWYRGNERDAYFDVRTSIDGNSWTTVLSQATAGGTLEMIGFDVADSTARYVEIVGLGNSGSLWNSILEVDIFGCGNTNEEIAAFEPVIPLVNREPPPEVEPSTGAVNVVFNGTFENKLSGWAQVEPAEGSTDAYEGLGSGKILSSGSIRQSIFLIPQSRYRASAFLQGNPTLSVSVGGRTFSAKGPNDGGSYEQVSFEFDSGSATSAELFVQASSSAESARADNIEVTKISGGDGTTAVDPNSVFDFSIWEVEGENPIARDGTLVFDALEQCVVTPNGNGCRHEMKVVTSERYGLTEQYEFFSANIQADLSPGAETIVVQHHPEETGTLAALYLTDRKDAWPGVENGIPGDGIFDVVETVRIPGSRENESVVLGTIRSGQNFDFQVINDHGDIIISAFGKVVRVQSADSSSSYLKFGNYLQARDPVTGIRINLVKPLGPEDRKNFLDYYKTKGITKAAIVFRNIEYSRTID